MYIFLFNAHMLLLTIHLIALLIIKGLNYPWNCIKHLMPCNDHDSTLNIGSGKWLSEFSKTMWDKERIGFNSFKVQFIILLDLPHYVK